MTGEMFLRDNHQSPHCMGTRTTTPTTTVVAARRDVVIKCVMIRALLFMGLFLMK